MLFVASGFLHAGGQTSDRCVSEATTAFAAAVAAALDFLFFLDFLLLFLKSFLFCFHSEVVSQQIW